MHIASISVYTYILAFLFNVDFAKCMSLLLVVLVSVLVHIYIYTHTLSFVLLCTFKL